MIAENLPVCKSLKPATCSPVQILARMTGRIFVASYVLVCLCLFLPNIISPSPVNQQYNLYYKNEWHTHYKIPMLCLMSKRIHSRKCSDGTTDHCQSQQSRLSYTPLVVLRLPLVNTVDCKRCQIDNA